jgi:hypothetical protein
MKRWISLAALVAAGCASSSKDITASYVSPLPYGSYTCDQLVAETARILARTSQLAGQLDSKADKDKALVAVSAIVFWPAIFFVGGNKEQEAAYGRLKGEYDAIQAMSVQKSCGMATAAAPTPSSPPLVPASATPIPETTVEMF